tara:strand:+ start:361 stop:594 length:234 start_codon:yes stop_codon:yes gene_type:complete
MKGFSNSIGWNLGKKKTFNHLLDPFTSIPIIGTNNKKTKQTVNKKNDNLNKFLWLREEKKIIKKNPNPIKNKCLKKK